MKVTRKIIDGVRQYSVLVSPSVVCTLQLDETSLWSGEGLTLYRRAKGACRVAGGSAAMRSLASHALARGSGGWDLPPSTIAACVKFGRELVAALDAIQEG